MVRVVSLREVIEIPSNVKVFVEGSKVTVKGPKGEVTKDFSHAKEVKIAVEDNKVVLTTFFANRKTKAKFYSIVSHIENMIVGVTKGFRYWLKIIYSHYPINVKVEGDKVIIENFIGEKAPRIAKIVGKAKVKVQKTDIIVEGVDIEEVGQTAANIEIATKIRGVDRRVFVDGIYIYKKEFMEGENSG